MKDRSRDPKRTANWRMSPLTCVVTGANSGIGKQAAIQLARRGARVIMACRDEGRGRAALEEVRAEADSALVELMMVDMSSMRSIREFARAFFEKRDRLDVLINNAAYFDIGRKERRVTDEGLETTWATNHIGPVLLTRLMLPALRRSEVARIVNASSKGLVVFPGLKVNIEDPQFESRGFSVQKAYYQSKLAQVAFTLHLARELEDTPVKVHAVRITNVKLDTSRYPHVSRFMLFVYSMKSRFSVTPQEMAETYTWLATSKAAGERTGLYWDAPGVEAPPSRWAADPGHRREIVNLTDRTVAQFLERPSDGE